LNSNIAVDLSAHASDWRRKMGENAPSLHPIQFLSPSQNIKRALHHAEFSRSDPADGENGAVGAGRRGEFAVLLEDGPYERRHVVERVFAGRMGGCGVCTWGVRWVWLKMWDRPINKREVGRSNDENIR
jgi:hypothetical protein